MQTVAAVVLNYNGWRDTVTCVRALEAMQPPPRIVVVDNASTDES
ncbi:MAG: glycosyltransferase family 2 protein, partial [Planctomycetes bacterium]|nr:glycosyltransferase family 2 protein [Planctomycetota bacterium]